jgi:activator of 2-hydroxyglutaryl-CoA dehydratase
MITAGIDAGSRSIKVVLFDSVPRKILACAIGDQGIDQETLAREVLERACDDAGLGSSSIVATVATGYGRNLLTFSQPPLPKLHVTRAGLFSRARCPVDN